MSAAIAFRRWGIEPYLVEIRRVLGEIGAGLHIPDNGVRALYQLGIGKDAKEAGHPFNLRTRFDAAGRLLAEEEVGAVWGPDGFHLGISRPVLHELLLGAANVQVRLGVEIRAIEQNERSVRVRFSDGTEGEFDVVVGADGVHSQVRSLAVSDASPAHGGDVYWRGMNPEAGSTPIPRSTFSLNKISPLRRSAASPAGARSVPGGHFQAKFRLF